MLLRYNINSIEYKQRRLDVIDCSITPVEDAAYYMLTFTTASPHKLNVGECIVFCSGAEPVENYSLAVEVLSGTTAKVVYVTNEESIESVTYLPGYYVLDNGVITKLTDEEADRYFYKSKSFGGGDMLKVIENNFTECTFSVLYQTFRIIYLDNVIEGEHGAVATVQGRFPFNLNTGSTFSLRKRIHTYQYYKEEEWNDSYIEVDVNPEGSSTFLGALYVKFVGSVYKWTSSFEEYQCTYLNYRYFTCPHGVITEDDTFEVEDNRLISKVTDERGNIAYNLKENLLFFEYMQCISLDLPLASESASELNDEDIISDYFKEKRESLIPKILDYEKRCFSPYYNNGGNLIPVETMKFNLFFRDRTGSEDWTSHDGLGWNQYPINEDGQFVKPTTVTNGDPLGYLNFTDNDVYYQKKKISKSFLRLSFYDNNNPLKQMLLFYSTIFLDSGELYGKYINNIQKKLDYIERNGNASHDFLVKDTTSDITASFTVTDKFDHTKSSEGFYLYLFPDGVQNGEERTIYMKAEFNHAGYGTTIPLIYPNNNTTPLSFKDARFPTSLIDSDNGNLKELYRQLYIPIVIKYDETVNDFIYYFKVVSNNNGKLTINLYEPKINPID